MKKKLGNILEKIIGKYNTLLYEDVLNDFEAWNDEHIKTLQKYLNNPDDTSQSEDYWRGMIQGHRHVKRKVTDFKGKHLR